MVYCTTIDFRLKDTISQTLSTSASIFPLNDHDHVAVSYSNFEEIKGIISYSILSGIEKNQINLWFVQKDEMMGWLEILEQNGINVTQLIQASELIIIDQNEICLNNSSASFNSIFDRFQNLKNIVIQKQKNGINVISTCTGNLFLNGKFHDCLDIEIKCHQILESFDIPITLLCLYHSKITEKHQLELIEVHNCGLLTLIENTDTIKRKLDDKKIHEQKYGSNINQKYDLEIFPRKELAVLETLNGIITLVQKKEMVQDIRIRKRMPNWYIELVESLVKLYDTGYVNFIKENRKLR